MPSQRRSSSRGGPTSGPGQGSRGARQGSTTRPGERGPRARASAARASYAESGGGADDTGTSSRVEPRGDARPAQRPPHRPPHRPRLTGRAAVLVLVLAVLTVSYASSLRAYLQQRAHIGELRSQIAEREASIDGLEREQRRWDDPAYVKAQARARFGYLMPGEQGFEVIGADGEPIEAQASLNDPDEVIKSVPKAWWTAAWESMELAGDPPPAKEEPADVVDGTQR